MKLGRQRKHSKKLMFGSEGVNGLFLAKSGQEVL